MSLRHGGLQDLLTLQTYNIVTLSSDSLTILINISMNSFVVSL